MRQRSFFSRLLTACKSMVKQKKQEDGAQNNRQRLRSWCNRIGRFFILMALISSAIWLLIAIWYQLGIFNPLTWLVSALLIGLLRALLSVSYRATLIRLFIQNSPNQFLSRSSLNQHSLNKASVNHKAVSKWLAGSYAVIWLLGVSWFMSIEPKQNRDWQADVSQRLTYVRDEHNPDLITLNHVRNFEWHDSENATERWENRTIDLSQLSGIDVINSYWMGPLIAHTLVSFRFKNERPLVFSLEIRKENGEKFSAISGFFRRFELSLIASEERDIIYTRSNIRGEQVYLFPISHLQQSEIKALFESYLSTADALDTAPAWYNTLTNNCTNIIFYMAHIVSGERLPWDYRIWVSGWLPNYLYEINMLDSQPKQHAKQWSMDAWYEQAHINPKVSDFHLNSAQKTAADNTNQQAFSTKIRQGLPIPPLHKTDSANMDAYHIDDK